MAETLPERANLAWLKKTAKQHLRDLRNSDPDARLAHAQLALARSYGFASWRALKAEIERRQRDGSAAAPPSEAAAKQFLRAVGDGQLESVRAMLAADPSLVDAVGPHPYWGGRPQALHVSIETKRRHMLARGIKAAPQEHARLGDKEALAALIAADPGIARQHAVMMGAVDFGHHELVAWLLQQGADVNARADWGSGGTALHSAAWNGDLRMARLLLSAGANVAARDKEHDNTPAGWAQVSITVSNNPKCRDVVDYFTSIGAGPRS